jgi:hypothetical protein
MRSAASARLFPSGLQQARTEFFAQGIPDRTRASRRKPAFTGLLEPERWVQQSQPAPSSTLACGAWHAVSDDLFRDSGS